MSELERREKEEVARDRVIDNLPPLANLESRLENVFLSFVFLTYFF